MAETSKDYLISIQYLRALAALMVVLHHARNPQAWLFNPLETYPAFARGVDIFFVISGFIMYSAARKENHFDFLGRRIIRIVPLYWLAIFVSVAIDTNLHIWWKLDAWPEIIKSLFFIPHYNRQHVEQIWPYLIPGWTLNYEMFFYVIFFIGLAFGRVLLFTSAAIAGLATTGLFFEFDGAIYKAYTSPITLEFLCGVWIGMAHTKGLIKKGHLMLSIAGFFGMLSAPFVLDGEGAKFSNILFSAMIVAGVVSLGKSVPHSKIIYLLGDASYSIYLSHGIISLALMYYLWPNLDATGWLQFTCWIFSALLVSSLVGVVVYLYVEKPMLNWLRGKWKLVAARKSMSGELR